MADARPMMTCRDCRDWHGHLAVLLVVVLLTACAPRAYEAQALDQHAVAAEMAAARLDAPVYASLLDTLDPGHAMPPARWSCVELGAIAVARSPAVAAARAALVASAAERSVAARGPRPRVTLETQYNTDRDPGDDSHWSVGPGFEYLWSPVDRGRIRVALVDADIVVARTEVLAAAWAARERACAAALDLFAARAGELALRTRVDMVEAAATQARAAVAAGIADPLEWQTLELEGNSARLERLDRMSTVAAAGADLAGALNLPLAALGALPLAAPAPREVLPPYASVQAHALAHHPRVLAALAAYDKAEHDLELAVAAQYPDIELSPSYFFDQGDHVWSLLGGVVVPLLGGHDAAIDAAAARRDAARAAFERVQAEILAGVQQAWSGWQAAHRLRASTQEALDAVAASVADLRAQLRAGAGNALMLRRAELQREAAALRLVQADAGTARAELELELAAALALDDTLARQLAALYRAVPGAARDDDAEVD